MRQRMKFICVDFMFFLCEILCLDWKNRGVYGSIEKNRSKNGRHCEKRCLPLKIWRKKDGTVQAGVYRFSDNAFP